MEASVLPVWPLAGVLVATNAVAVLVLAIVDDSAASLIGGFFYLAVLVAVPMVLISIGLAALGYRYGLAEPLVACGAVGVAWLTWGLMIAVEGDDSLTTAVTLFVAQFSAAGVNHLGTTRRRRA